jgi:hypothetical protein
MERVAKLANILNKVANIVKLTIFNKATKSPVSIIIGTSGSTSRFVSIPTNEIDPKVNKVIGTVAIDAAKVAEIIEDIS